MTATVVDDCLALVLRNLLDIGHQLVDRYVLETRAFQRGIEVVDVSLMVTSVVNLHRHRVDLGFQRVIRIG